MNLAALVDGPVPGCPGWLACTPTLVPGRDERDPPSPGGGRARVTDPRAALAARRNEHGDDGSPEGAAGDGAVDQPRETRQ
jgi:hypothetical protein